MPTKKRRSRASRGSRRSRRHGNAESEVVPVIFRVWPKAEGGGVIALFPTIPGSARDRYSVESYQHVGQHGAASMDIIHRTRPATPAEYASLKRELERAPYHYKLKVYQRATHAMQDKLLKEARR
jgi:hypothetical protein